MYGKILTSEQRSQIYAYLQDGIARKIICERIGISQSIFCCEFKRNSGKYGNFHEHKGLYGYRRVTAEMRSRCFIINHKTDQRLMQPMNIKSQIRKVRYHSYKGEVGRIAPNIINRDFASSAPNQKWATDVTQINIGSTKLYLSPILDMFNGEVVSCNISQSPNLEQIYHILDKAFAKFDGLILHSD